MTNAFINARKAVDQSAGDELENVPILSTSVAYGVYMAVSSNLRYVAHHTSVSSGLSIVFSTFLASSTDIKFWRV